MVIRQIGPYQWTQVSEAFYDILTKFIERNCHTLELGSSTGHISFRLANEGYRVTLLDIREEAIKEARHNFRENAAAATFIAEDFLSHNLEYDFVWCSGLIQCFTDRDKMEMIQHAALLSDRFLAFYPDTDSQTKIRGTNRAQIPGVGDALEYSVENVPLLMASKFGKIFFGRIPGCTIDMPFDMLWVYGKN